MIYEKKEDALLELRKHYLRVMKNARREGMSYKSIYQIFFCGLESEIQYEKQKKLNG